MIKQAFFIDVGVKRECETVFQWIGNKIDMRIRKRNRMEKKLKEEEEQ